LEHIFYVERGLMVKIRSTWSTGFAGELDKGNYPLKCMHSSADPQDHPPRAHEGEHWHLWLELVRRGFQVAPLSPSPGTTPATWVMLVPCEHAQQFSFGTSISEKACTGCNKKE